MPDTSALVQTLLALLAIPSETGKEENICSHVEKECDSLSSLEKIRIGNNLLYFAPAINTKSTILLFGHLDTVSDQQDRPPFQQGDKIYGCGASDMKGGLAIMLEIAKALDKKKSAPYNLGFIFYDREEGPYEENGLGEILEKIERIQNCDLALVLEPTGNAIQVGCVGGLHAEVTYRGKSAHSARPWEGENALQMGGELLSRLALLQPKEIVSDGLKFYEVINATMAKAGVTRNTIPATFELNLNYRFAPGKRIEQAKEELLKFIGVGPEVKFVDACPSGPTIAQNPLLEKLRQEYRLPMEAKQAWTDIARLGLVQIPAINFGPGESSQAHQKNEWISEATLQRGYDILASFLLDNPSRIS